MGAKHENVGVLHWKKANRPHILLKKTFKVNEGILKETALRRPSRFMEGRWLKRSSFDGHNRILGKLQTRPLLCRTQSQVSKVPWRWCNRCHLGHDGGWRLDLSVSVWEHTKVSTRSGNDGIRNGPEDLYLSPVVTSKVESFFSRVHHCIHLWSSKC